MTPNHRLRRSRHGRFLTEVVTIFTVLAALLAGCSSGNGSADDSEAGGDGSGNSDTASGSNGQNGVSATVKLALEKIDVDLDSPIAAIPGIQNDSMIVAERAGTIRVLEFNDGNPRLSDPVIDISDETSTESERGLLGVALSPDDKRIFLSYTAAGNGTSRLDAFDIAEPGTDGGQDLRVDRDSRANLLSVTQPFPNHNGGHIEFGPDGMLYMGLGDGGAGGDPYGNAQKRSTLLGKILRLNPDATGPDDVAAEGNPGFGRDGSGAEIWLTGVRNPWRFSFDSDTGDLWIADVGQNTWEEVNLLTRESGLGKGANLGWDLYEGTEEFADTDPAPGAASDGPFVEPVYTYRHDPGCSITGGVVYRGEKIPSLVGTYLFSDYCDPTIRGLRTDGPAQADSKFNAIDFEVTSSQVVGFATDAEGETYVLSIDGGLFRIVDADTVSG